jgi:serine/threonine protein phosphatase PrpC
MNLEIAKKSYAKPHKRSNGDFCAFEILGQEQLVVLTLADGVGSSPCDWKASELSCQKILEAFTESKQVNLPERIKASIQTANNEILLTTGRCVGMKSTLCVVVWDVENSQIHFTNIGDSRIYALSKENLEQISVDEVKSVILKKKDGKPIIISGTAVVAEGVTNVMGSHELDFDVKTASTEQIDAIILSTDGFHRVSLHFEKDIIKAVNSIDLDKALEVLYEKYRDDQKDDMTILVARKSVKDQDNDNLLSFILEQNDISNFREIELIEAMMMGLERGMKDKDAELINEILSKSKSFRIDFGRENLAKLIALMFEIKFQDGEVYQQLLSLMRNSKY